MRRFCAPRERHQRGYRNFESLEPRLTPSGSPAVIAVEVSSTSWDSAFYNYLESEALGQFGYAIPSGASQQKVLPWSNLDRVYITFDEDVNIDANDLAITGVNVQQYDIASFVYDPQLRTARWTLAQSFSGDRILLDLNGGGIDPVTNLAGEALDGEWTNSGSSFPSGNGDGGGDFEFTISSLVGDVTREGAVTYPDYSYVYLARNKSTTSVGYKPMYDIDGNGIINSFDYGAVLQRLGNCVSAGEPAGSANDSPTSTQRTVVSLGNSAVDEVFSLYDLFDDEEDSDSAMTYSLISASNPALFNSIDMESGVAELRLSTASSGSGVSEIVVRAADSGGLYVDHTIVVGVNHINNAPTITNVIMLIDSNGSYWLEADVLDADEDTAGWIVECAGVHSARAVVTTEHKVRVMIVIPTEVTGWEYLSVQDSWGASTSASRWVGAT
jgi:hypothetical protein